MGLRSADASSDATFMLGMDSEVAFLTLGLALGENESVALRSLLKQAKLLLKGM